MYACLDLGGTSIKVAVSDDQGHLEHIQTLNISHSFDELMSIIVEWIEEMKTLYPIEGVAMSAPGAVDSQTGIIGGASALPCIHGPNWKEIIQDKTGLSLSIENDANCAALAEAFNGKGKDYQDIMFVVCGTGIGGAIIKNGQIHHGKHLFGGEVGFMLMEEKDGRYCNWSEVASTMSFVRKIRSYYQDDSWTGERIFEAAQAGDEKCQEVIDTFYKNLAKGIFNLQHIYDPEIILLGGAISNREDFIPSIEAKLKDIQKTISFTTLMPHIDTCTHKKDANLVGALANYLMEHHK